ncbi:hypothetical protein FACS1894176_03000 [Bacteroidia bacterium]|nr:hypothetical protein FACS1894176_03000 [Bacteroidia bacterium]
MKQKILGLGLLFFVAVAGIHAQVNIGSADTPTDGAILDLSQVPSGSKLGLILPHVVLSDATHYRLGSKIEDSYPDAAGTVVYNTGGAGALAAGIYIWDGNNWLAAGGTVPAPGTIQVGPNTYTIGYFGNAGWWMTENLREIPVSGAVDKGNSYTIKYYNYPGNSEANVAQYGYLYSWTAAMNLANSQQSTPIDYTVDLGNTDQGPVQGICPVGWHLPSDKEWSQLEEVIALNTTQSYSTIAAVTTIEGDFYSGAGFKGAAPAASSLDKKMKANQIWSTVGSSKSASEGGFSALPAGSWNNTSAANFGTTAYFWSSSSYSSIYTWCRYLVSTTAGVNRTTFMKYSQFGVRCKKD